MKNFIKKFWTHVISFLFFIIIIVYYAIIESKNEKLLPFLKWGLILELILVLVIWGEIIYFIIQAIKHKEIPNRGLKAVMIYFLNVFYIPCFYLKYIYKDEKYKIKNTAYVIYTIGLFAILLCSMYRFATDNIKAYENDRKIDEVIDISQSNYISSGGNIKISVPTSYKKSTVGEYDMYFEGTYSNMGVFIYENEDSTAKEILEYQENYLKETRTNFKVENKNISNLNDKKIESHLCEGYDKENNKNVYMLSTITFNKNNDYVVYVVQIVLKEQYSLVKNEFQKNVENINLV
ncbi:MAG: hypothetical protein J6A89_08805 [Clostridia bacterium]|nr:hypothetical protein [Clostridia bacterium]